MSFIRMMNLKTDRQRRVRRIRRLIWVSLVILGFFLGLWCGKSRGFDAGKDEGRRLERSEISITLYKIARGAGEYEIEDIRFKPRISPRGLKLIDLTKVQQAARKAGQ